MNLLEKILKKNLEIYLGPLITSFKDNKIQFLTESKQIVSNTKNEENILKLYYFTKFFRLIFDIKKKTTQDFTFLTTQYITELDQHLINEYLEVTNRNSIYTYLKHYGNFRKSLLDKIYDIYSNDINKLSPYKFTTTSQIFLLNNYQKDWETIFLKNLKSKIIPQKKRNTLLYRLIKHTHIKHNKEFNDQYYIDFCNVNSSESSEVTITNMQLDIENALKELKINYIQEYTYDHYNFDFYLPDLKVLVEFDGPVHFYPMQTQYKESQKYRLKYMFENSEMTVVNIPGFEQNRWTTQASVRENVKKLIFEKHDIFNGPLFNENYDMQKPLRKYL